MVAFLPIMNLSRNPVAIARGTDHMMRIVRPTSLQQLSKFGLINNFHSELIRLIQLRSGFGASQHEISFLTDRRCYASAPVFDLRRSFIP